MSEVVDARGIFGHPKLDYKVQIVVAINFAFICKVIQCIFTGKDLRIIHIFTNDPIMHSDKVKS